MAVTSERAFSLIESAHERKRLAHAFLVTGAAGSGKEALASRVIGLLNGGASDAAGLDLFGDAPEPTVRDLDAWESDLVRIVRPQSKSRIIRVDDMRALEKSFYAAAPEGKWKIGVVVDADRMNDAAANAFLKTLEEPPVASLMFLLTTKPERLLPTILSRCVRLNLLSVNADLQIPEWAAPLDSKLDVLFSEGFAHTASALTAKATFSELLTKRKSEISKKHTAMLKDETALYKNTTDGSWLKDREDFYKALTEAEYLEERSTLIEVLIHWMGKKLKTCVEENNSQELQTCIVRMQALEELRANLETNAQEELALSVGFVSAFAE